MSESSFSAIPTADAIPIRLVPIVSDRERVLLMSKRQAIIIELGAIEDYLGLDRSIRPQHKRDEQKKRATIT